MDFLSFPNLYTGDSKRDFNPTCYRTDAQYSHMVSNAMEDVPEKSQKFSFDIILKKKVQTYIQVESSESSWPVEGTLIASVFSLRLHVFFCPR